MTDEAYQDLKNLTLATSERLVGLDFVRPNPDGPEVVLHLVKAAAARRDPSADQNADQNAEPNSDRPFTLLFRGSEDPRLTQGQHDLIHRTQTLAGIFLVPVDGDPGHAWYEAVFS